MLFRRGAIVSAAIASAIAVVVRAEPPAKIEQKAPELSQEELEKLIAESQRVTLDATPAPAMNSSAWKLTEAESTEIARLIESLTELNVELLGGSGGFGWGSAASFMPCPVDEGMFFYANRKESPLEANGAAKRLIELGPKALAALLDALSDATPTKGLIDWEGVMGGLSFSKELSFNTATERERRVREAHPKFSSRGFGGSDDFGRAPQKHAVTRGDLCMYLIGQIVNRGYSPSRYQPTSCAVVSSPTHDPEIAAVIRDIWSSGDAAQRLFESLWSDFQTRGQSADGTQAGAALRLLYWFPKETAGAIARRIDALQDQVIDEKLDDAGKMAAYQAQREKNQVEPSTLAAAAKAARQPEVDAAIARLAARATTSNTFIACLSEDVVAIGGAQLEEKLVALLAQPSTEQWAAYGKSMLLGSAVRFYPTRAEALFEQIAAKASPEDLSAYFNALAYQPRTPLWVLPTLVRFLDDQRDTRLEFGMAYERTPLRICDLAAQAVARCKPEARFKAEGTRADLDRQIADIRRVLAGETVEAPPTADEIAAEAIAAAPLIKASATVHLDETVGQIDPSSGLEQVVATQYQTDQEPRLSRIVIDMKSGQIVNRLPSLTNPCGASRAIPGGSGKLNLVIADDGSFEDREPATGTVLRRVPTPFHKDFTSGELNFLLRGFSDVAISGDDRVALAITADGVLRTIDLENGLVDQVWEGKGRTDDLRFAHWNIHPFEGTNRFLIDQFAADGPAVLWDQDAKTAEELPKMPSGGWSSGWRDVALNIMNSRNELWNVRTRQRVPVLIPGEHLVGFVGDAKRNRVYAYSQTNGVVVAIDLDSGKILARMPTPRNDCSGHLTLSRDKNTLFWQSQFIRKQSEPERMEANVAAYDVSGIAER